jgi:hypothetical protein
MSCGPPTHHRTTGHGSSSASVSRGWLWIPFWDERRRRPDMCSAPISSRLWFLYQRPGLSGLRHGMDFAARHARDGLTHTRPRRHVQTHQTIPATATTGSTCLALPIVTNRWYCSLDRNCIPCALSGVDRSHQKLLIPLTAWGPAVKAPTAAATARHVTGKATQNQGNPGARSSRARLGKTTRATNATTPSARNSNHATT